MTDNRDALMKSVNRLEEYVKGCLILDDTDAVALDMRRALVFIRAVTGEPSEGMSVVAAELHEYYPFSATVKEPAEDEQIFKAMIAQAIEEAGEKGDG